ncbi:MAG: flagellar assembly protein FliH [Pseudomonadota bacterium]|nr:flagellar assembly protein FliH [Pseudomonadota bacterium]
MKNTDPDSKLIPKEQLTAWERWELPLLDARGNPVEEEVAVKPLTAADIEAIREEARQDGFEEGRKAGYAEGFNKGHADGHKEGHSTGEAEGREHGRQQAEEAAREELKERMARLEHLMGELMLPIQRHQDELESALVNLTTEVARAVVYRELTTDSSQIHDLVRKALAALPSTAENLRIHIHPDDVEPVTEAIEALDVTPSIVQDAALTPGGCRVESRHSLVDFTVEKRFQQTIQQLMEEPARTGPESDEEQGDELPSG